MQLAAIKSEQGEVQEVAGVFPGELAWQGATGEVHEPVLWQAGLGIQDVSQFCQRSAGDQAGCSSAGLRRGFLSLAGWLLPGLPSRAAPYAQ